MKFLRSLVISVSLIAATTSFAQVQKTSVVNKTNCDVMVGTTQPFILVLDNGDDLIASISQCAKDAKLPAASVTGLGQLQDPTLAYFTSDPNAKPTLKKFNGFYELAAMNGDITNNADDYYTHLHIVLADKNFRGIAGHLNNAKAGITVEITIIPFPATVKRIVDANTGFGPIEH